MSAAVLSLKRSPLAGGGEIVELTLNRPEKLNAINRELQQALKEELGSLAAGRSTRALLLDGAGRGFCSGADLKERAGMRPDEVSEFLQSNSALFEQLAEFPAPTIAVIHGAALGGGLELALCCDLRLAAEDALLGLPETSLGIIPGAGGTQRLPRLIGASRAAELIYCARRISGIEAANLGLVNRALPAAALQTAASQLAAEIAANAPIALRQAKLAMARGMQMELSAALQWEQECYQATIPTHDRQEALAAFREKRRPIFTGE
ncbi:MAG: enoyl-CoA hydratase/isomerase family protein [Leptospirales bacterium]|nr:enoyl-CoA hydratase/isomerase family protein [Leptospirales bacterium]